MTAAPTITLIAAVARNGIIGAEQGIPWRIPEDWRRFKELTMGHVLVMGRRTFDSIGKALPGRITIVITRDAGWSADGAHVTTSVPEALALAAEFGRQIYVAGGAEIYRQTLDQADRLELTWVDAEPAGDTSFPDVAWGQWREAERLPRDGFAFVTYARR